MLGFLSDARAIDEAITGFLAHNPNPTPADIAGLLSLYSGSDRVLATQLLLPRVPNAQSVLIGRDLVEAQPLSFHFSPTWALVSVASSAASAYHGYKRNQSVKWGVIWGLLGGLAPILTPAIAVAQGFGKRKAA